MTPEHERWAEALLLHKQHGRGAALWIAERTAILAGAGDVEGLTRMRQIATKLEQLLAPVSVH